MISSLYWDNRNAGHRQSQRYVDDVIVVDRDIIDFNSSVFSGLWSY